MRYIPLFAGIALLAFSIVSLVQLHDTEPREITIDDVIAGNFEDDEYVRITGGWAFYDGVYEWTTKNADDVGQDHNRNTKITCFYYPLFSPSNPICQDGTLASSHELIEDEKAYDGFLRSIKTLKIVVKTKVFETLGDLPDPAKEDAQIVGKIKRGLTSDADLERNFAEFFSSAGIKGEELILIEEDKIPGTEIRNAGIIFGAIITIGGLILVLKLRSRDKAAERMAMAGQTYQAYSGSYQQYGTPQQPGPPPPYPGAPPQQPGAPKPPKDDGFSNM